MVTGVGRALVVRPTEEGCNVAIFDLKPDAARETEQLAGGGSVRSYEVDVGDDAAVVAAAAKVEAEFSPIWALANNAGMGSAGAAVLQPSAGERPNRLGA